MFADTNSKSINPNSAELTSEPFELTESDQSALLRIAATAQDVTTLDQFIEWTTTVVDQYFPHKMLLCAAGSISGIDVHIERIVGIGYPAEFLNNLGGMANLLERPVLRRWLAENRPQLIDETLVETLLSPLEQEEVKAFSMVNIAAYGVLDLSLGRGVKRGVKVSHFAGLYAAEF